MIHGTWQQTGGGLPVKALELIATGAFLWWLWTVLWVIAVALGVLLALAVTGLILLRRHPAAEVQLLAQRAEALRLDVAERGRPQVTAAQPPVINHYHGGTHVHVEAGADPAVIRRALGSDGLG